jgi:hypothetical protein
MSLAAAAVFLVGSGFLIIQVDQGDTTETAFGRRFPPPRKPAIDGTDGKKRPVLATAP